MQFRGLHAYIFKVNRIKLKMNFLLSFLCCAITNAKVLETSSYKVFESTVPLGQQRKSLSGLQFVKNRTKLVNLEDVKGISICGRFNYKTLNNVKARFMIIQVIAELSQ